MWPPGAGMPRPSTSSCRTAPLDYPGDPDGDAYRKRLLEDATPRVRDVLHREFA